MIGTFAAMWGLSGALYALVSVGYLSLPIEIVAAPAIASVAIYAIIWVGAVVRWVYQLVSGDRTKVND
jgi:hypothetical protein